MTFDPAILIVIAVIAAVGYFVWKKKAKKKKAEAAARAELDRDVQQPVSGSPAPSYIAPRPYVAPSIMADGEVLDPLGAGFKNRAQFDLWKATFTHVLYLDGAKLQDGFGPGLAFETLSDGRIVRA